MEKELFAQNETIRVFLSYCLCQIKRVLSKIVIPKGFFLDWNACWLLARRNIKLLFLLRYLIKNPF